MGLVAMVVLHLVGLILAVLDFSLWLLTLGPMWMVLKLLSRPGKQVVKVGEGDVNDEGMPPSPVYRLAGARDALTATYDESVGTVYDLLSRSARLFAEKPAQAWRAFEKFVYLNEGDRFPAKVFGDIQTATYAQLGEQAHAFGAGLRAMGMEPMPEAGDDLEDKSGPFKMLIFEDTSAEWMVAAQGAFTQSMVVFTAYATLGMDAVVDAVQEGECVTLVCNYNSLEDIYPRLKDMPTIKNIVYTYLFVEGEPEAPLPPRSSKVTVRHFSEVLELGRAEPREATPPKPNDMAVVMYTSGSTGKPKGVLIRHRQVLGCIAGITGVIKNHITPGEEHYLAYLPLAHILEMAAEFAMLSQGNCLCYSHPKDLSTGPGKCHPVSGGALAAFRPTAMAGVPKIWEVLKKGAETKIEAGSTTTKFLFKLAMKLKGMAVRQGRYTPLFDLLVFKKFKGIVGGRLNFTLSGGGPIAAEVQEWIRTAFGCPMVQGYGLTEISGAVAIQDLNSVLIGVNGPPISSVEVLLHSEPDFKDKSGMPYLATDTADADGNAVLGRGEIWVRGINVTSGYYKKPDKTAEDFDADGWFHTGDIGQFTAAGDLKIVDRKKNLVKLKGGEYIATEAMQVVYGTSAYVDAMAGGVMAYGDATIDRPVALVQAAAAPLKALAARLGVEGSFEELAASAEINGAVLEDLIKAAKRGGLSKLEHVCAVALLTEPWTPENGMLTATNKLQPRVVAAAYPEVLEGLKAKARR